MKTGRKTIVCPVQFIGEPEVKPFETTLPDLYWAELTNGSIIGGSSVVVTEDGTLLYDMLSHRKEYEANMTDNGLCLIGGSPQHIGEHYIYNYLKGETHKLQSAISLSCNMSNNYYHFMLQVASRHYLLSLICFDQSIPLVVDECVLKIPQMKEVIEALNADERPIISIKANQRFKVQNLYVLSEPHVIVPNSFAKGERRTENFAFDTDALKYIRDTLKSRIVPCTDKYPSRVFLSRKGCTKRRCNEEELEKVFAQFGFVSLRIDNMTIAQQMALFGNAEHVIGGSGAAFTNLIYCKEGTKATLFFTGHRNNTCFSNLGCAIGIKTYYTYPEKEFGEIHTDYYEINPDFIFNHLNIIYG
ncbi:MAG: glycosyltransferase family 61 protein [Candidatus Limimorpha sp.]